MSDPARTHCPEPGHDERPVRTPSLAMVLAAATAAMVMLVLDSSIVGVMLPSMRQELRLGPSQLAWVVAAYLLTLTVLLPVGGRLSDAWGAARAFAAGLAGFTAASLGVGLAATGGEVVAWRAAAGCAAALMMPAGLAMIVDVYPEARRAAALALYTGVGQGFATLGPAVGGVCAQFLGWRWGFLVNAPVGLAGLVLLAVARPAVRRRPVPPWDLPGVAGLVVGAGGLFLALLQGPDWGWTSPWTLGAAVGGGLVLVLFVRHCTTRPDPVVDLRLLRERRFAGGSVVLLCLGFGMTAATIYGAATLQETLDLAPAVAGLALLPLVVPLLAATRWAALNYASVGPRAIGARGALALALGLLAVALGVAVDHVLIVCAALVPAGAGIGLLLSPMTNVALSAVPDGRRGQASGIVSMLRQAGGVVGVGVVGALVAAWPATADGGPAAAPIAIGFVVSAAVMLLAARVAWRTLGPLGAGAP